MVHRRNILVIGVVILATCSALSAAPVWPADGDWTPIVIGPSLYTDARDGPGSPDVHAGAASPDEMDLVGGMDPTPAGPFPTGLAYSDGTDLMFRLRVDGDPTGAQMVWLVLLDTGGDDEVDWVLSLVNSGPTNQVDLVPATSGGPSLPSPWNPIVLGAAPAPPPVNSVSPLATWSRLVNATAVDGSEFGGDDDFFVDMAFPVDTFLELTGLSASDMFGIAFATSADHVNVNKDLPDNGWGETRDGPIIPEPTTMLILAASMPCLLKRKRNA